MKKKLRSHTRVGRTGVSVIIIFVLFSSFFLVFDIGVVEASASNVNTYMNPEQQRETSIAVNPLNPDNIVIGFNDFSTGECRPAYTYSTDGGETWTYGGALPQGTLTAAPFCDPWLAFDGAGYLYYVALSHSANHEIFVCIGEPDISGNVGPLGFGDPQIVDDGSAGRNDKPVIAVDTTGGVFDGNIYVAWCHIAGVGHYKIWLRRGTRTDPTTITWSEEGFQVSPPGELYTHGPQVAVGPSGWVYVTYQRMPAAHINDADELLLSRSIGGGAPGTWSMGTPISDVDSPEWFVRNTDHGARHSSAPTLCISSDTGAIFVAWTDDRHGDDDILLSRSTDGGDSWLTPPIRVNDDALSNDKDQLHPAAVVSSAGVLDIIFYDRRDDPSNRLFNLYLARSWDDGDSWTNYIITDEPTDPNVFRWSEGGLGDYIGIASAKIDTFLDRTFMAWADARVGTSWPSDFNTDIFFEGQNVSAYTFDPYFVIHTGASPIRSCVPPASCAVEIPIQLISIYDFENPVELSVTGLPTGSEYSFDTTIGVPPFETKLQILLDSGTGAGKYEFTVAGTSSNLTQSKLLTLEVTHDPYIVLETIYADPDEAVALVGHGFTPNASYIALLGSKTLQSGTIDSVGSVATVLLIPSDTIAGNHTVTVDDGEGVLARTYLSTPRPHTEEEAPPAALQVDADGPYVADIDSPSITLEYTVSGGEPPYSIQISWGDGSPLLVENQTTAGTSTSLHTYPPGLAANYVITVTVNDGLGSEDTDQTTASITHADYAPDDWPMFRHDLGHTGYSTSPAPNTNRTLWKTYIGSSATDPVVHDGRIYVLSQASPELNCVDALTGEVLWKYWHGGTWISSPSVLDGRVYFGSDSRVYCVDASTGTYLWNYTADHLVTSSPAVVDNRVYVGSGSLGPKLYCLDALTGTLIWDFTTGIAPDLDRGVWSSPAVVEGNVYVGTDGWEVLCLDASTSTLIWNFTIDARVGSASPTVADGKVYIGSRGGSLFCIDALTGASVWNYTTLGSVRSTPALASGRLYISTYGNATCCLDASTGANIWNFTTGGHISSSPAVADGKLYVGSSDRNLYCLDAVTGVKLWSYVTKGEVESSPAVVGGILYFTSADGYLYAVSDSGGGDWPMFHHDLTRSGNATSSAPAQNTTIWTYTTDHHISSSPAVVAGKLYIGLYGRISCLNMFTGSTEWTYTVPLGFGAVSSPAVWDDRVYVGALDRYIYCLDAATGTVLWSYGTDNDVNTSPAVADGRVYVGSWDDYLYCLDALTGALLWRFKTGYDITMSSAAVADGRVYVGSMDKTLYCLNASTGTSIWNFTAGSFPIGYIYSTPAIISDRVYLSSNDYRIYCLDAFTGTQIWNYTTYDSVLSSPAIANDRVYVGSGDADRRLYCLNATTGALIWDYKTGGAIQSSPAVAGAKVIVGSDDSNVYCFDAVSGSLLWKYTTGGRVLSSPAIAGGQVYIGSMIGSTNGTLYAFGSNTYRFPFEIGGAPGDLSIVSNSRISYFSYDQPSATLSFNVSGTPGTPGFANITFPTPLIDAPYTVLEDDTPKTPVESSNDTHTSLYIDYVNGQHVIKVIGTITTPELPAISVDPLTITFPQGYPMDYPAVLNTTTISNIGNDTLTINSVTLTLNEGDAYTIDAIIREAPLGALFPMTPPFTLAPGKSAYVQLKFNPIDMDPYHGTLRIVSNDPNNLVVNISLFGSGAPPSCNQTCTSTVEWYEQRATDSDGRWVLPIEAGGNITEYTVISVFNMLEYNASLTEDNRGIALEGTLEHPNLPGQMILEVKSTNSSEKLTIYDIHIMPYPHAMNVYTVEWGASSFNVTIQSNSTITHFAFSQPGKRISFNVTVPPAMLGYCNVTIPKALLGAPYTYLLDGELIEFTETSNATHTSVHFTYPQDGHVEVIGTTVIPEYTTSIVILLLLALSTVASLYAFRTKTVW